MFHPRWTFALTTLVICLLAGSFARADEHPLTNGNFEADASDGIPGWFVPPVCAQNGWSAAIDTKGPADSKCAVLRRDSASGPASGFGNIMQSVDATPFRGKRVEISVDAAAGKANAGRIQPWVRVDRANQQTGFFDNCQDRPVTSRTFTSIKFIADIEDDAEFINIGMMVLNGDGPALLDNVKITPREKPAVRVDPPVALTPTERSALVALARVLGYVRHYHPSDQAAGLDWLVFSVEAVRSIEGATDAATLASKLNTLLAPIAPTFRAGVEPFAEFDPASMLVKNEVATRTLAWHHRGFNPKPQGQQNIYVSKRVSTALGADPKEPVPSIGEHVTRTCEIVSLDGASQPVHIRVPIVVYADDAGTLPVPPLAYSPTVEGVDLSVLDRSTRLAGVMVCWNVLQHHYPYFHVVQVDWDAALEQALVEAATCPDAAAYGRTLDKLFTTLQDGHGSTWSKSGTFHPPLPILVEYIDINGEQTPVVTQTYDEQGIQNIVSRGDVILSVDGRSAKDLFEEARLHEPAANIGNLRFRAARRLVTRSTDQAATLRLRNLGGEEREVTLKPQGQLPARSGGGRSLASPKGPVVRELEAGYWYVDLDRATDADLEAAKADLAKAKGIVFDMRGYPDTFSMGFLGHLTRQSMQCANWHIPIANWPDRHKLAFDHARWGLPVQKPFFSGKVAFITDGRAISAAETFMGIVEAYTLGEIVGEPTAGTNGNVNTIELPGGYSAMFTGMKVVKHDGTEHHMAGVRPTVPCTRTLQGIAEGRDELLDKALETVKKER